MPGVLPVTAETRETPEILATLALPVIKATLGIQATPAKPVPLATKETPEIPETLAPRARAALLETRAILATPALRVLLAPKAVLAQVLAPLWWCRQPSNLSLA